jgi:hypothetical protein
MFKNRFTHIPELHHIPFPHNGTKCNNSRDGGKTDSGTEPATKIS